VRAGAVIPMGPELQYANERTWDPLSFEIYPGESGRSETEVSDDRRHLRLRLAVDDRSVLLEGGRLNYEADVFVHRPGGPPIAGRLGRAVVLP